MLDLLPADHHAHVEHPPSSSSSPSKLVAHVQTTVKRALQLSTRVRSLPLLFCSHVKYMLPTFSITAASHPISLHSTSLSPPSFLFHSLIQSISPYSIPTLPPNNSQLLRSTCTVLHVHFHHNHNYIPHFIFLFVFSPTFLFNHVTNGHLCQKDSAYFSYALQTSRASQYVEVLENNSKKTLHTIRQIFLSPGVYLLLRIPGCAKRFLEHLSRCTDAV